MTSPARLLLVFVLLSLFIGMAAITQLQAISATAFTQQPTLMPTVFPQVAATPFPDNASIQKLVVTKLEDTDDGSCDPVDCSLREAIAAIENSGEITLQEGLVGTIALLSMLDISSAVTIIGPGPKSDALTIKATAAFIAFNVAPNGRLVLRLLTLTGNDFYVSGGGINVNKGYLAILQSTISKNKHWTVLNNRGTVVIEQSTFVNNESTNGGAVENYFGKVTIRNSTFFGNKATGGGAIMNYGEMIIEFSTFSNNEGLIADNIESHPAGQIKISNTILSASGFHKTNCEGIVIDNGNNLQTPKNDCGRDIQVSEVTSPNIGPKKNRKLRRCQ